MMRMIIIIKASWSATCAPCPEHSGNTVVAIAVYFHLGGSRHPSSEMVQVSAVNANNHQGH